MNFNYRKSLKLLTLLITSILIATVSASTYVYMYIDGSITIGTAKLVWIEGLDAPEDVVISGGTVIMNLDVQPGLRQNFTDCLFLKNQDSAAHNLTITVTTSVSSVTFDEFYIHIYKNETTWAYVDTLDGTISNDQYSTYPGDTPLIAGGFYRLAFQIKADASASGTVDFDICVTYE